jgi:Ca2+-binding RTX toxin-like protein
MAIKYGTNNSEVLQGTEGSDSLYGYDGNDTLKGGGGNDTLVGGAGADWMDGGAGIDTADYSASSAGVSVRLDTGTGYGGDAAGDTLSNIENLTGSAHMDVLYGNSVDNTIDAGNGNDFVYAGAGNDIVKGGGGDDQLYGDAGSDLLIGGAGADFISGGDVYGRDEGVWVGDIYYQSVDTLSYSTSPSGVQVVMTSNGNGYGVGGDANGDTFTGIENVEGSGYDDNIWGDNRDNRIEGLSGNDQLMGRDGNDTLVGGAGVDQMWGGTGSDNFVFQSAGDSGVWSGNRDIIHDFQGNGGGSFGRGGDRIDLSQIDANTNAAGNQAFTWIGTSGFTGVAGQLMQYTFNGNTILSADLNGDRIADFQIEVAGIHTFDMTVDPMTFGPTTDIIL